MNKEIQRRIAKMKLTPFTARNTSLPQHILQLPPDYIDFISYCDGAEGFINDKCDYLMLWPLDNVVQLNPYLTYDEFSKEVIMIGSNGSGYLYGFDLIKKRFFGTDEYQLAREEATYLGQTFMELLEQLEAKNI